jgi:hypothetical protein
MSLLIKQGEIVTGTEHYIADIYASTSESPISIAASTRRLTR